VNHGVLVWCYCWKSYVWQGKMVSCVTWFSSSRPINNSAESENLNVWSPSYQNQNIHLASQYHDASPIRLLIDEFVIAIGDFLVYAYYIRGTSLVRNYFE
jgi:hypothetical protein